MHLLNIPLNCWGVCFISTRDAQNDGSPMKGDLKRTVVEASGSVLMGVVVTLTVAVAVPVAILVVVPVAMAVAIAVGVAVLVVVAGLCP